MQSHFLCSGSVLCSFSSPNISFHSLMSEVSHFWHEYKWCGPYGTNGYFLMMVSWIYRIHRREVVNFQLWSVSNCYLQCFSVNWVRKISISMTFKHKHKPAYKMFVCVCATRTTSTMPWQWGCGWRLHGIIVKWSNLNYKLNHRSPCHFNRMYDESRCTHEHKSQAVWGLLWCMCRKQYGTKIHFK